MKIDKFKQLKDKINNEIESNNKFISRFTTLRGIGILLFIIILLTLLMNKNNVLVYSILLVILFSICIILSIICAKYKRIDKKYRYSLQAVDFYLKRFNDQYKKDKQKNEYAKGEFFETDLDIFGQNSLYNYISVSKTEYGKKLLSESLEANLISEEELEKRQNAILDFSSNLDSTIKIVAASFEYEKLNPSIKLSDLESGLNSLNNIYKPSLIKVCISIIYIICLVSLFILGGLKIISLYIPLAIILLGFFLSMFINSEASLLSNDLSNAKMSLYGYNELIDEINKYETSNSYILKLKEEISHLSGKTIKQFNIISSLSESRKNIIFQLISNGLFMLDSFVVLLYYKWQNKYKDTLKNALISIGEIESLISLGTISLVKETSCLPKVSNNLEFIDIKHPLIIDEKCIPNSFIFSGRNIITGSNMSGKTTFMRSIGTNYVLFLAGSSVCAKSFNAPILKLFTSMKVVDDVNNNISTFYGEILRIKAICEYARKNEPMLVLVDEIFKGTNTRDRIVGATAAIEKLDKENIYSIVTTHDPELCLIQNVKNYHFLEHYEDDKIMFDYKIHDGISQTRNAIYLLKLAGIIDDEKKSD